MREFAKISCSIWSSEKFTSLPDDNARLLYLYLHTCPHVNSLGCYVLRPGYALSDLGWDADTEGAIRYRNGIEALSKASLIGFDKRHNLVRIVDFLKHSPFANPKHAKGALNILDDIPECEEKSRLIKDIEYQKHLPPDFFRHGDDTVSIPYRNSFDIPETRDPRPETRDPRPETKGGGVSAQACDDADLTYREKLLHAAGIDPRKTITPGPKAPGSEMDMIEARKWLNDSRFGGEDEIVQMVSSIRSGMRDPPSTLRYFTKPLLAFAAAKSASLPAPHEVKHDRPTAHDRRSTAASERLGRILDAAARTD